jgi:hypothetical protein
MKTCYSPFTATSVLLLLLLVGSGCWAAAPQFELLQSKTDPTLFYLNVADDDAGNRLLPLAAGLRRAKLQRSEAVCKEDTGCVSTVSLVAELSTRCDVNADASSPNSNVQALNRHLYGFGGKSECIEIIGYEGKTPEAEAHLLALLKQLKAMHRLWTAASFNLVQAAGDSAAATAAEKPGHHATSIGDGHSATA